MPTVEERMTKVEQDVSYLKANLEHVATKSDFAKLETYIAGMRTDMIKMNSDLKSELTWRMFAMVVGTFVTLSSALGIVFAVTEIFD